MSRNLQLGGRVLVLDHRDSFVFTLVDQFAQLGAEVRTLRTNVTLEQLDGELTSFGPDLVVLSPGPGHPSRSGVMVPFLQTQPRIPVLGVCLGHQAIAVANGGDVAAHAVPVHGRGGVILHEGDPAFDGLPRILHAGRYHSLHVTRVPPVLQVIARLRSDDGPGVVMAVRHRTLPQVGLQFHPESVLTPFGGQVVSNILHQSIRTSRTLTTNRS